MKSIPLAILPVFLLAQSPAPRAPLQLEQTITLEGVSGRIDHLAIDVEAKRLYAVALGNDTLEVIDLARGKRVRSMKHLGRPTGIAFDPKTGLFAVASSRDGCCRIFDRGLELRARIDGFYDADNVRFNVAAKRFVVGFGDALGSFAAGETSKPSTGFEKPATARKVQKAKKLGAIAVGGHPESFQLEPGSDRVFVNVPGRRAVVVVDSKRGSVIATWRITRASANYPMALDAAHHRLILGCRRPARLVVLDTESGKVVTTAPCCGDADDLFYDAVRHRVYVSGGAGRIDVFEQKDADHYELRASIKTVRGARTSLYDPKTSRMYLAVPRHADHPAEIRVFQVGQ